MPMELLLNITYDEASDSYTTDAPDKYTVYPLTIENPDNWSSGYNYVYFNIDGRSKALTLSVYDKERFKYNLNSIGLDQTDTVRFIEMMLRATINFISLFLKQMALINLK